MVACLYRHCSVCANKVQSRPVTDNGERGVGRQRREASAEGSIHLPPFHHGEGGQAAGRTVRRAALASA